MPKDAWICRAVVLLAFIAPLRAPALGGKAAPESKTAPTTSSPSLHILSDTVLSASPLQYAVDVRWAGDHSVYLSLKKSGVVEYSLDGKAPLKQMIPGSKEPGGFWLSYHLAVSPRYLVDGSPLFALTWRPLDSTVRKDVPFEGIDDLDIQGNKVAVVGVRRGADRTFAPDGAIAWIGSLDKDLTDLKPLLFDAGGAGAPSANACGILMLGATRFLPDGSLWVAPGIQPGLYRFDPQGKLLQTVDTVKVGVDTDCAGVSKDLATAMKQKYPPRLAWVNARRIVDDVLPLPSGPGLLIRSLQQGQVRWTLKVLHPDSSVAIYDVPVHAQTPFAHLKGDLRQGRLVLLCWENAEDGLPDHAPKPHLLIASLPGI
jgi:hypothetical protein